LANKVLTYGIGVPVVVGAAVVAANPKRAGEVLRTGIAKIKGSKGQPSGPDTPPESWRSGSQGRSPGIQLDEEVPGSEIPIDGAGSTIQKTADGLPGIGGKGAATDGASGIINAFAEDPLE